MPNTPRILRTLFLLGSILIALLLGELLIRVFGPPVMRPPKIWIEKEGRWEQVQSMTDYLEQLFERDREALGAKASPYEHLKGWYDRPQWDYFDEEGCVHYRTNRFGFRDQDFEQSKPSDEYRILAIGDSFTFGLGVQGEDCWTEALEALLEQKKNQPCQVINGSYAAGNLIAQYPDWFANNGLKFEPDLLLIVICLNDLDPDIPLMIYDEPIFVPWLKGRSRLLYQIQKYWIRLNRDSAPMRDFSESLKDQLTTWEDEKEAIRKIQQEAEQAGVQVVVAVMPMLTRLAEVYPFTGLHKIVADFCRAEDLEVVDLLDAFLGRDEEKLWVHPTDQHPNHVGHLIIAETLCSYLSERR